MLMKFSCSLNMNLKVFQAIFFIVAMTFTTYNIYDRFFTKRVKLTYTGE